MDRNNKEYVQGRDDVSGPDQGAVCEKSSMELLTIDKTQISSGNYWFGAVIDTLIKSMSLTKKCDVRARTDNRIIFFIASFEL